MTNQSPGSHGSGTLKPSSREKLLLSRGNLAARLRSIDINSLDTEQRLVYEEIEKSLSEDEKLNWFETYKVEQQFGQLLGGERLRFEIEARLGECETQSIPGAKNFKSDYENLEEKLSAAGISVPEAETIRRDFHRRVLANSQWFYRTQSAARPIYLETTKKILGLVLLSMVLVAAPYVLVVFSDRDTSFLLSARYWEIFPLYTAISAGFLGACFSRLILLQRNWNMSLDDVLLQREASYIWLRAAVGTCGALIVFFFLRSGIVSGPIFPNLGAASIQELRPAINGLKSVVVPLVLVPSPDLALLMVWSFIAGFSEALVPTILTRTEGQLSNAAAFEKK